MSAGDINANVRRAELTISWTLRVGVMVCGIVIALGLSSRLLHIGTSGGESSRQLISELRSGKLVSEYHPVTSPLDLIQGWRPDLVITAGLLLLIALPILRVAMTVVIFFHERDWPFVGVTLIVLSVLLSGIFLGRAL